MPRGRHRRGITLKWVVVTIVGVGEGRVGVSVVELSISSARGMTFLVISVI
jgi:hypothetical protein